MATTTSVTTTYAGEAAGRFVSAALLSADTIDGGGVTIKPNVKFKEVLKTMNLDAITKDATCDFSDTSTLTLAESILEVKQLQVNLELCKSDFEDDWYAAEMGFSAHDNLPATFSDYLIGYVASKVAAKNETNIWQGVDANAGEFDGFTTLAAANADVIDVTGTTITAANVITELGKVVDAIPAALYGKEDLYIYVSQHIARSYVRALGGFGASGLGANGVAAQGTTWYNGGDLAFDGVKLFVASGLPTNDMIAAQKSNLYFGSSLLADWQEVKLLDMADLDGSKNVRVIMRMAAGCAIGIGADVVYYT
jgi:hypothetical protein